VLLGSTRPMSSNRMAPPPVCPPSICPTIN
jgi:hypothetical protein